MISFVQETSRNSLDGNESQVDTTVVLTISNGEDLSLDDLLEHFKDFAIRVGYTWESVERIQFVYGEESL